MYKVWVRTGNSYTATAQRQNKSDAMAFAKLWLRTRRQSTRVTFDSDDVTNYAGRTDGQGRDKVIVAYQTINCKNW